MHASTFVAASLADVGKKMDTLWRAEEQPITSPRIAEEFSGHKVGTSSSGQKYVHA